MVGKLSLVSNSTTSSKQAIAPVGSKAQVSGNDILGSINGTNVEADTGKTTIDGSTILPGYTGTANSRQATQNRQVAIGVDNGRYNKNPGIAGTTNVGTGTERGFANTIINPIGSGAAGDGRGVANLDPLLALKLEGARNSAGFGPGAGFGGASGQMPQISFPDMGLGGSGKKNNESTPSVPQRNPGPTQQGNDRLGQISQRDLDQSIADGRLLEKNSDLFGKDNKLTDEGKKTLNKQFEDIKGSVDSTKLENVSKAFEAFKDSFGGKGNVKKEALDTFRKALEKEGIKSEPVIEKLLGKAEEGTTVL